MKSIDKLLGRMRTLWVLEHCSRRAMLIAATAINACLLCLLLNRLLGLPIWSVFIVAALAIAAALGVTVAAMRRIPPRALLAQLVDIRAGTHDLFASALEFSSQQSSADYSAASADGNSQSRFGSLGDLTCQLAFKRASQVVLRPDLSLGARRNRSVMSVSAGVFALLLIAYLATTSMQPGQAGAGKPIASAAPDAPPALIANAPQQAPKPAEVPSVATSAPAADVIEPSEPDKPAEEAVKITNEMINDYMAQMPQQEVDLEGVTPIRWDMDEASGKNNPQNQDHANDKIDPVKLDAALLKDLQTAKKTKEEGGGKEGGVDVAVMGEDKEGAKAKGQEGGKNPNSSLADAVSKDPRGNPTRLAIKLTKQGLQIRSAFANQTRLKGEDRPMGLLEFLVAMKKAQLDAASTGDLPSPQMTSKAGENIVHVEGQPDDSPKTADVVEAYFSQLRKADK